MPLNLRALLRLTIPIILLGLAIYLLSQVDKLDDSNRNLLSYLPYLLTITATLFALQFNRSRLLACAVLVGVGFWAIQNFLQTSLDGQQAHFVYTSMTLLLPLNIVLLAMLPERGLWNHFGILYLLITPVLMAWMYWLYQSDPGLYVELPELWHIKTIEGFILSKGGILVFAMALVSCLLFLYWRNNESEAVLALCLASGFATLGWLHLPMVSTIFYSAAALGIIAGVFRSSHEMAYRDELTGLPGRRALNERMRGLGRRYCIAMIDIDHFKKLNDNHGHDIGDEVLKLVATRLAKLGGGATTYRYGGEEFCALFPQRDLDHCLPFLEDLREEIAGYRMAIRDKSARPINSREGSGKRGQATKGVALRVTISIGAAERAAKNQSADDVLKVADQALYHAKKSGRNRVSY